MSWKVPFTRPHNKAYRLLLLKKKILFAYFKRRLLLYSGSFNRKKVAHRQDRAATVQVPYDQKKT